MNIHVVNGTVYTMQQDQKEMDTTGTLQIIILLKKIIILLLFKPSVW